MSPASYRAAPPRVGTEKVTGALGVLQIGPGASVQTQCVSQVTSTIRYYFTVTGLGVPTVSPEPVRVSCTSPLTAPVTRSSPTRTGFLGTERRGAYWVSDICSSYRSERYHDWACSSGVSS